MIGLNLRKMLNNCY